MWETSGCRLPPPRPPSTGDPARTSLGALLATLERIGYRARPADPRLRVLQGGREDRVLLVRAGLSLFLAMNVMLASLGL